MRKCIYKCSTIIDENVKEEPKIFSTITADGDCSHEIKRRLLLGRKTMTNQQERKKIKRKKDKKMD